MKVFADENIPSRTVEELRSLGHDVLDIRGTAHQGSERDTRWGRTLEAGQRGCKKPSQQVSFVVVLIL